MRSLEIACDFKTTAYTNESDGGGAVFEQASDLNTAHVDVLYGGGEISELANDPKNHPTWVMLAGMVFELDCDPAGCQVDIEALRQALHVMLSNQVLLASGKYCVHFHCWTIGSYPRKSSSSFFVYSSVTPG